MNTMKRLIMGACALSAIVGLAACGEASSDAAPSPTFPTATQPTADSASNQVAAIDIAWASDKGSVVVCPVYNQVRGNVDQDTLDDYMVGQFEGGFGQTLKPAARAHLLSLVHGC